MSKLQLYKASAGSGKTFRLAIEYLKIALSNEWNYKHILAVTFTNKATTEMKYRVVEELFKLSNEESTAYMEVLTQELSLSELEISLRAKKCLKHILHDYSRFSVSTIDSFFQRVIRAFNRELGINTAYQVDLEENLILEEAVDQLLLSVSDDSDLLDWLKQFGKDKILEGQGWNLKKDILTLGNQIYNETFKEQNEQLYERLNDKTFIKAYRKELQAIIVQFEQKLKQLGKQGINIMDLAGVAVPDFKYGKSGPANAFNQLLNAELRIGKRIEDAINDVSFFYKKTDAETIKETAGKLQLLLIEAVEFYQKSLPKYNTARLINKQLYTLAILVDLQSTMRKLVREKGVVLISESGNLLKEIISDADAPFVYEKTGTFYHHFMIDEFQDTSGLQWGNFQPLISNSLAEDNFGMVVGDIKQAIYRWRNGDWRLLAGIIADSFKLEGIHENVLDQNWRSSGNIIRFNNSVFNLASHLLDIHFSEEIKQFFPQENDFPKIEAIYNDSIQQIGKSSTSGEGYIRMRFHDRNNGEGIDFEELILDELVEEIKNLQDQGAPAGKIAILVRKKDEAKIIADRLLLEKQRDQIYNFNVLSSESLYVKKSPVVSFLLNILELQLNPDDELIIAFLNYIFHEELLPELIAVNADPKLDTDQESGQLLMNFEEKYAPGTSEQFEQPFAAKNKFTTYITSNSFKKNISSKNIQEAIFEVCNLFNLFELKEEQAYLQAFIDQVGAFLRSRTVNVSSFLNWWNEQGQKKTIAVSEDLDAIRIQTVHKAKGLEYNYVLVPFCDWPIGIKSVQHAPVLWCKPQNEPFNQLELVPVKYESAMAESFFKKEYFEEKVSSYIDNLNLLYVAFTRARGALYTWSVCGEKKLDSVGELLLQCLNIAGGISLGDNSDVVIDLDEHYDPEERLFEYGELKVKPGKSDEVDNSIILDSFKFAGFNDYLRLRRRNENFFSAPNELDNRINTGKIIHEILAMISTVDELEPAIEKLILQGVVEQSLAENLKAEIESMINDPEIKSWFDGTYRVVNERSILSGNKKIRRPDRIMLKEDETIVVDYKSGDLELEKYHYQVRNYMKELKACGYNNIQGFIWYTKTNKREPVFI